VTAENPHAVGLRELRHDTGAVLARVQQGETIDVTQRGRLIARITPVPELEPSPVLERLRAAGRLRPAVRPGYRPNTRRGDGTDRLNDALAALRAEESW
jgi:prevent-host-death family protein